MKKGFCFLIILGVFLFFTGCVTQQSPVFSPAGTVLFPSSDEYLLFKSQGKEYTVKPADLIPTPETIFETKGAFTVKSSVKLDSNGNITDGSAITYEMIMREVQKSGGDDFIHLRIDEIQTVKTTEEIIKEIYTDANNQKREREKKITVVSYSQIDFRASAIAIKYLPENNFVTKGVFYLSSFVNYNANGNIIDGSKITYEMLMQEVKKLGGDDFINLRIDEIQIVETTEGKFKQMSTNMSGEKIKWAYGKELPSITRTEYKATAIAITYKESWKDYKEAQQAIKEAQQDRSHNKR